MYIRLSAGVGPLVVRPDSGDPSTVIVKVLEILGSKFGTTINSKGYRVLPPYVRVIQAGVLSNAITDILPLTQLIINITSRLTYSDIAV